MPPDGGKIAFNSGVASSTQAQRLHDNLSLFEQAGGLEMSTTTSGMQWDAPFGWAPTNWLAVAGLSRYGYNVDAQRISRKFISTVDATYAHDGTIREKYNVVTPGADATPSAGYKTNVIGFGWTNAAFLELLHGLPKDMVDRLEKEQNQPLPR